MGMFFLGIIFLITGGFVSLFFNETSKLKVVSVFSCIASIVILFSASHLKPSLFYLEPFGNITFSLDALSLFFVILISLITAVSSIYAIGYMQPYTNTGRKLASHCFFLPVLTAAMLLVVTVQNALLFLVIWELMSLSSFFLVIFEDDKKEVLSAGIKYLIYMHISVLFIIAAFALMSIYSNSYDFNNFKQIFNLHPYLKDIVFILAFIGFGTKAGFFPLHNWLPYAHPAAPSHVSAVMSAVMIKTGIYGILRILQIIQQPSNLIAYITLFISVITTLYGIIYAVGQKDIKKLLAYSSVENIGIIGISISIIMFGLIYQNGVIIILGTLGCFMHILNHSVFKSLLFMGAGCIYLKTHTKNMELLGGLIKKMPCSCIFLLFGTVAICAFPPLNGFIGEFLIYCGLFNMLQINNSALFVSIIFSIAALAFAGTLVILAMSKLYSITLLGLPRSEAALKVKSDVSKIMLIPMGILAALTLIIGILSPVVFYIFLQNPPIQQIAYKYAYFSILQLIFYTLLMLTVVIILFIVFIIFIFIIKKLLSAETKKYSTWGCGYDKGNNHIQYTASSYVSPFTSILTPLFKKIFDVKKPKGLFPQDAHYKSVIEDVEEAYLINPVLKFDEKFLTKFERLQDGNIQHYILYGLIFLILLLIGAVFIA